MDVDNKPTTRQEIPYETMPARSPVAPNNGNPSPASGLEARSAGAEPNKASAFGDSANRDRSVSGNAFPEPSVQTQTSLPPGSQNTEAPTNNENLLLSSGAERPTGGDQLKSSTVEVTSRDQMVSGSLFPCPSGQSQSSHPALIQNSGASNQENLLHAPGVELNYNGGGIPRSRMVADDTIPCPGQSQSPSQPAFTAETAPAPVIPPSDSQQQDLGAPSGIAGAVLGMMICGPACAAIAGLGSAYAVRKEGATGNLARALGEAALSVQASGQEFEEKHHVWRDTKAAIEEKGPEVAIEAKSLVQKSWASVVESNRDNDLMERCIEFTGHGFEYFADTIRSMAKDHFQEREMESARYQNTQGFDPSKKD